MSDTHDIEATYERCKRALSSARQDLITLQRRAGLAPGDRPQLQDMQQVIGDVEWKLAKIRERAPRPRAEVIQLHPKPWPHAHRHEWPQFTPGPDAA